MRLAALAFATVALAASAFTPVAAQPTTGITPPPPAMQRAIEEMLDPATRAEIRRRVNPQNPFHEVLETVLLNNLQIADAGVQGAKVIAVDYTRQVAVVELPGRGMQVIPFDRRTLRVRR